MSTVVTNESMVFNAKLMVGFKKFTEAIRLPCTENLKVLAKCWLLGHCRGTRPENKNAIIILKEGEAERDV